MEKCTYIEIYFYLGLHIFVSLCSYITQKMPIITSSIVTTSAVWMSLIHTKARKQYGINNNPPCAAAVKMFSFVVMFKLICHFVFSGILQACLPHTTVHISGKHRFQVASCIFSDH